MLDNEPKTSKAPAVVLYDGECPQCIRSAAVGRAIMPQENFSFQRLQDNEMAEALGLERAALERDLHLVLPSGEVFRGADAYRRIARSVWWLYPLYVVAILPGVRSLTNWLYRQIADRRYMGSKSK